MAYQKQTWRNLPDQTTPLSAARLNHLETQYSEAVQDSKSYTDSSISGITPSSIGAVSSVNGKEGPDVVLTSSDIEGADSGEVFNVLDFGAKGDGVSNDREPFQQALDAAFNAGGGEVVVPPGGPYLIGSQIVIRANTILSMYGAEIRKPSGASFPWIRNFQSGVDNFPGFTGNGNIVVRGGIINAQAHTSPSPGGNTLCFEHAENIEVRDVTFLNAGSGQVHALEYNAIKNGRVLNCRFLGYNSHDKIAEAIQLDIAVSGSGNLPPADETTCEDILIQGCMMDKSDELGYWGALVGSHTVRAEKRYSTIRVLDNVVLGSLYTGIRMHQWEDTIVQGNFVVGAPEAGIICETGDGSNATGSNRILISGNIVRDCENGILVAGVQGAEFREMVISNNIIRDSATDGINVNRTDNGIIIGNSVTVSGEDGIQVHNSRFAGILNNRVNVAGRYGILGSPGLTDSHVQGNYVSGSDSDAIRISSGSSRNLVSGNVVRRGGAASPNGVSMSTDSEDNLVYGNDLLGTDGVSGGTRTVTTAANRT